MSQPHLDLLRTKESNAEAKNQVSRIKERVEEKEGIPPVQQRLIYGGKQMYEASYTSPISSSPVARADLCSSSRADDKTASEYNLEGGATLHLVLALRGGSNAL